MPAGHQQAVAANFDLFHANWLMFGEKRNLDLQIAEFFRADWSESCVVGGCAGRAPHNTSAERLVCFDHTDAATELLVYMNGHEHAAELVENCIVGYVLWERIAAHSFNDGFS